MISCVFLYLSCVLVTHICTRYHPYIQSRSSVATGLASRGPSGQSRIIPRHCLSTGLRHPILLHPVDASWVIQREGDISRTRATRARGLDTPRRTNGPSGTDTLFPPALGDVDRRSAVDRTERELRRPRLARRRCRCASALCDSPGYAAAYG